MPMTRNQETRLNSLRLRQQIVELEHVRNRLVAWNFGLSMGAPLSSQLPVST